MESSRLLPTCGMLEYARGAAFAIENCPREGRTPARASFCWQIFALLPAEVAIEGQTPQPGSLLTSEVRPRLSPLEGLGAGLRSSRYPRANNAAENNRSDTMVLRKNGSPAT